MCFVFHPSSVCVSILLRRRQWHVCPSSVLVSDPFHVPPETNVRLPTHRVGPHRVTPGECEPQNHHPEAYGRISHHHGVVPGPTRGGGRSPERPPRGTTWAPSPGHVIGAWTHRRRIWLRNDVWTWRCRGAVHVSIDALRRAEGYGNAWDDLEGTIPIERKRSSKSPSMGKSGSVMAGNPSRRSTGESCICMTPTCNAGGRVAVVIVREQYIHVRKCDPSSCPSITPLWLKHGRRFRIDARGLEDGAFLTTKLQAHLSWARLA